MTSQEEILDIYQKFTDEFDVKQALLNLMEDQQMLKENEKSKAICEHCKKVVVTTMKKTNYMRTKHKLFSIIFKLIDALEFYADPDTYFAIGFFPDPPCGEFIEDFDEHKKPGARARKVLETLVEDRINHTGSPKLPHIDDVIIGTSKAVQRPLSQSEVDIVTESYDFLVRTLL